MLIGAGTNGVVLREVGPDNVARAVKYWIAHKGVISYSALYRAAAVSAATELSLRPGVEAFGRRRMTIWAFGPAFPTDAVLDTLRRHGVEHTKMIVSQVVNTPACTRYTIAHGIPTTIIANGAIAMPLAGADLYRLMPIGIADCMCLIEVLCRASLSAFGQGRAIPDLKPANICQWPHGLGWVVVDIDDLPGVNASAAEYATLQVAACNTTVQATISGVIFTAAMAIGSSHVEIDRLFLHTRAKRGTVADVGAIVTALPDSIHRLLSPLVVDLAGPPDVARSYSALLGVADRCDYEKYNCIGL